MTSSDESWLRPEIEHLTKEKQLSFALLLCERIVPALEEFARETDFDGSFHRNGLDGAWQYLKKNGGSFNYSGMAKNCLDQAPDTEEFSHPLTSAALDAALSIAATISFLADHEVDHLVEAAGLARDTAALYAQAIETAAPRSLGFDETMKHPLVQRELRQQAEDLEFLRAMHADDSQRLISLFKERAAGTPGLLPPEIY